MVKNTNISQICTIFEEYRHFSRYNRHFMVYGELVYLSKYTLVPPESFLIVTNRQWGLKNYKKSFSIGLKCTFLLHKNVTKILHRSVHFWWVSRGGQRKMPFPKKNLTREIREPTIKNCHIFAILHGKQTKSL